jgi:hypothetical protein
MFVELARGSLFCLALGLHRRCSRARPPCVTFYEGTLVNGSLKKRSWLARVVEKGRLSPTDFLPEV